MTKSFRPQFGLSPSKPPHKRKGRAAKTARQERAKQRRDANPGLYRDMQ